MHTRRAGTINRWSATRSSPTVGAMLGQSGAAGAGFFGLFFVIWLTIMAVGVGGAVFQIMKIVEVVKLEDWRFPTVNSQKTNWLLVVILAGFIGSLIWQFSDARRQLLAQPAAGWYADPWGGELRRWFDGIRWTEHTQ